MYNKIESSNIYTKLSFWTNNKMSTNSLEEKSNYIETKINN